jgi:hypothetical protein
MHIDQPALSSWTLLNLWKSDLLVDLVAQPDLLKAFRKLVAFLVARWNIGGCV